MELNERLSEVLEETGAVAFGISPLHPVEDQEWKYFLRWIDAGMHAGMKYMENYPEIRRDPRLLIPGAQSIISIAFNYRQPNPFSGIATYALGKDYHKAIRRRLKKVVGAVKQEFGGEWRICIDSAPVLERYWARKCGVGERSGIHGNIIVPGVGSMVFLAELVTTLPLEPYSSHFFETNRDTPETIEDPLSDCTVCKNGALQPGGLLDSCRCINYLTIEHKGEFDDDQKKLAGQSIFGCDRCLRIAPENRLPAPPVIAELSPMPLLKEFLSGEEVDFNLSESPLGRCDHTNLRRRIPSRVK